MSTIKTDRVQPDHALCRVKKYGILDFFDCLMENQCGCRHAVRFGNGFLCHHPQRELMAARTAASQAGG